MDAPTVDLRPLDRPNNLSRGAAAADEENRTRCEVVAPTPRRPFHCLPKMSRTINLSECHLLRSNGPPAPPPPHRSLCNGRFDDNNICLSAVTDYRPRTFFLSCFGPFFARSTSFSLSACLGLSRFDRTHTIQI